MNVHSEYDFLVAPAHSLVEPLEKNAAVSATPEMLAAVAALTKKMQTVKAWPEPFQGWFKSQLQKGDDGIKGIVEGVRKDMEEFKDADDDFKQKCMVRFLTM